MKKIAGISDTARAQLNAHAGECDVELVEIALAKEPQGLFLRLFIDKAGGVTLDDCERFHRRVLPICESVDYDFMEVSSLGADAPLKTKRDFDRAMNSKIEVRLYAPLNGSKVYIGVLSGYDGAHAKITREDGAEMTFVLKAVALIKPIIDIEEIEE